MGKYASIAISSFILTSGGTSPASADDLDILKERFIARYLASPNESRARSLMASIGPDGAWQSIDYADSNRADWDTARHMSNIRDMAAAWRSEQSYLHGDPALREAIFAALDYWIGHDFINPNWWFNEIGVPRSLAPACLMMDGELAGERRAGCLRILERSRVGMTGQNLVWVSEIAAQCGILERDTALVHEAFDAIAGEIRISEGEGIQQDYSFHQHGPQLYSHGYGAGFITDSSRLAVLVAGTEFAFSRRKTDLLAALILDGHQWLTRGRYSDYSAEGREITRKNQDARHVAQAARTMLDISTGREDEFRALIARADGDFSTPLHGNRHFWRSDTSVHQRRKFYTSVRMYSTRTLNTELINREGMLSHHLADGCNYLMRRGDEYYNLMPVWDWRKIPGTTTVLEPELSGDPQRRGETSFVGGVSDGDYGMAAFDFRRDSLAARKSWFFSDDEYVCLGAGISNTGDLPVITTLNQCRLHGDVIVSDGNGVHVQDAEEIGYNDLRWVHHDSTAYVFMEPAGAVVECGPRTGSWRRINATYSDDIVREDIFTAYISHDIDPNDASYAYIVAPGIGSGEVADYAAAPAVTVIANSPELQAVRHTALGISGMAFYRAGACDIPGLFAVAVDQPCLVLIREEGAEIMVSVSNPENEALDVAVDVSKPLSGDGVTSRGEGSRISFTLPGGLDAGKSVTKRFTAGMR